MAKRQAENRQPNTLMRPNIRITHALNGRVKDYAAERGMSVDEAYRRIIKVGLEELERREENGEAERQQDVEEASQLDEQTEDQGIDVDDVVERVSESWDDDDRLDDRRAAARAVLSYAVNTGEAVGKQEAIHNFREEFDVDGQNEESWWRQNIRPVLKDVGTYSKGQKGYVVE